MARSAAVTLDRTHRPTSHRAHSTALTGREEYSTRIYVDQEADSHTRFSDTRLQIKELTRRRPALVESAEWYRKGERQEAIAIIDGETSEALKKDAEVREYAGPSTTMQSSAVDSDEDCRRRMEQIQRELGREPDDRNASPDPDRERRRREREQRHRERES